MILPDLTLRLQSGAILPESGSGQALTELLDPEIPDTIKSAFLIAQMQRGLQKTELVGFASALLQKAQKPTFTGQWRGQDIMDCCGTGGGGLNILNVSTGIVFILAAAGIPVVKHGNRGVTKRSGSADVLEALSLKIDLTPRQLEDSLETLGWGFVFAPYYHPSFKAISLLRNELGSRGQKTIFNYLGPLLNPVRPRAQVMGVFQRPQLELYSQTLQELGCPKRCIVYSEHEVLGPLGEACLARELLYQPAFPTLNWELAATPEMIEELSGTARAEFLGKPAFQALLINGAKEGALHLESIYKGEFTHRGRGLIIANAAIALVTHGTCRTLLEGVKMATEMIDSKAAFKLLQRSREWAMSQK